MKLHGLRRRLSFGRRMTAALGAVAAVGVLALAAVTTGVAAAGTSSGSTARPLADDPFPCTVLGVAAYTNRVHVRCAHSSGENVYFAVPTSDGAHADRVLHVATTAMTAGRTVTIWHARGYNELADSIGCAYENCRLLLGIDM